MLRQEIAKVKAKGLCGQSVEDEHDKQEVNDTMYKTIQKVRRHVSDRGDVGIKLLHRQKRSFSFRTNGFALWL